MSFTVEENSEYGDSAMGVDMGMVGRKDSSKLRRPVEQKKPQLQLSKKAEGSVSSSAAELVPTVWLLLWLSQILRVSISSTFDRVQGGRAEGAGEASIFFDLRV